MSDTHEYVCYECGEFVDQTQGNNWYEDNNGVARLLCNAHAQELEEMLTNDKDR